MFLNNTIDIVSKIFPRMNRHTRGYPSNNKRSVRISCSHGIPERTELPESCRLLWSLVGGGMLPPLLCCFPYSCCPSMLWLTTS